MRISLILAHPDPRSFNHAIAQTALSALRENGHQVAFHDLYAEGFDPLLPAAEIPEGAPLDPRIAAHCAEVAAAEGIVIVHPNWWGQPPAILKGWWIASCAPASLTSSLKGIVVRECQLAC